MRISARTSVRVATVLAAGSIFILGPATSAALAYPPGVEPSISCDVSLALTGSTISCSVGGVDTSLPVSIAIVKIAADGVGEYEEGGPPSSALVSEARFELADTVVVSRDIKLPSESGVYRITATVGDESTSTVVKVRTQAEINAILASKTDTGTSTEANPGTGATNVVLGLVAGSAALLVGFLLVRYGRSKKL